MKKLLINSLLLLLGLPAIAQITTDKAPAPVAPYSQSVWAGDLLFVSGQIGLIPGTKDLVKGDIKTECKQVMDNLGEILKVNELGFSNLVKVTIYMTDISYYKDINEVYGSYFSAGKYPAREALEVVALPLGARVEISAVGKKQ